MAEKHKPEGTKLPEEREQYQKLFVEAIRKNPEIVAEYQALAGLSPELLAKLILKMDLKDIWVYVGSVPDLRDVEVKFFAEKPEAQTNPEHYDFGERGYINYDSNRSIALGRSFGDWEIKKALEFLNANAELVSTEDLLNEYKGSDGVFKKEFKDKLLFKQTDLHHFRKREQNEKGR